MARALWLVTALLIAGCSAAPAPAADPQESALEELDLKATPTTGVLRGIVVDEAVRPVADAEVHLLDGGGAGQRTNTTALGAFGFDGLAEGTYFLEVTRESYVAARQTVEVLAGVDEPDIVRVVLLTAPRERPAIEEFQVAMFTFVSYFRQNSFGSQGNPLDDSESSEFFLPIAANATVAQAEFVWRPTTSFGPALFVRGGSKAGTDTIETAQAEGLSPLLHNVRASNLNGTADNLGYFFRPGDSGQLPIPFGLMVNQRVDAYVHVFYNLEPNPGWRFSVDGAHPVPP